MNLLVPSDGQVLSSDINNNEDKHYHVHFAKKLKAGSHVPCKSDRQQLMTSVEAVVNPAWEETHPTYMDDNLSLKDTVLKGLDSFLEDPDASDDLTNPFDFSK